MARLLRDSKFAWLNLALAVENVNGIPIAVLNYCFDVVSRSKGGGENER
jgi:hypothetical protein